MKNSSKTPPSTALLFDQVKSLINVKSDRALAERLEQSTTSICRMRSEQKPLNPQTIISIHEETLLPIYAINLLAGISSSPFKPPAEIFELLRSSQYYQAIVEARFCFCISIRTPSVSKDSSKPDYVIQLQECTGYQSEPGGVYGVEEDAMDEFEADYSFLFLDLELSECSFSKIILRCFLDSPDTNKLNMIDSIIAQMIAECPRFYAIKAEHEASILSALITSPQSPTQRGRL